MPLYLADDLAARAPSQEPSIVGKGLLPETGCLLLTGRTETGKSVVAFDMALSLALGEPLFDAHNARGVPWMPVPHATKVLYLDSELGPSGAHQRLAAFYQHRKIGVLGDNFKIVSGKFDALLLHTERDSNEGFKNLEQLIAREHPQVVVIDPFSDYHLVDENDNQVRVVFKQLRYLQNHYHFASILLHHESDKDTFTQTGRAIQREGTGRARGHSAIAQSVDTMLAVRRNRKAVVTWLELTWEKCRHQTRPPNGWLFADFSRMLLEWKGTTRQVTEGYRQDFLEAYLARNPELVDEE